MLSGLLILLFLTVNAPPITTDTILDKHPEGKPEILPPIVPGTKFCTTRTLAAGTHYFASLHSPDLTPEGTRLVHREVEFYNESAVAKRTPYNFTFKTTCHDNLTNVSYPCEKTIIKYNTTYKNVTKNQTITTYTDLGKLTYSKKDKLISGHKDTVEKRRKELSAKLQEFERVSYTDTFTLIEDTEIEMCWIAPNWTEIQSGAKKSSGVISYMTEDDSEESDWWSVSFNFKSEYNFTNYYTETVEDVLVPLVRISTDSMQSSLTDYRNVNLTETEERGMFAEINNGTHATTWNLMDVPSGTNVRAGYVYYNSTTTEKPEKIKSPYLAFFPLTNGSDALGNFTGAAVGNAGFSNSAACGIENCTYTPGPGGYFNTTVSTNDLGLGSTTSFTLFMIINLSAANGVPFGYCDSAVDIYFYPYLAAATGKMDFIIGTGTQITLPYTSVAIGDGKRHCYMLTYESLGGGNGRGEQWVDGINCSTANGAVGDFASDLDIFLGGRNVNGGPDNELAGNFDNFMIVEGVRSSAWMNVTCNAANGTVSATRGIQQYGNTAPTIADANISPTTGYTDTLFYGNVTGIENDTGDTLTGYCQIWNGSVKFGGIWSSTILNNTMKNICNITPSNTTVGETYKFEMWVGDGTVNSSKLNTTAVTILDHSMNFTLISYSPDTLNETSAGNYTRRINITDLDGINATKCFSAITILDTLTGTYYNSLRIPSNSLAINVSGYNEYGRIFRADNRNKSKIFEGLPFTESNIWKWNIMDPTSIRMNIEEGGTTANITISGELHDLLFPSIWTIDRIAMESALKTMDPITKNNPKLIGFINPLIDGNYTLHHHLYLNYTGNPDELLIIRYCNYSYDPLSNIKPKNSPYCSSVASLNRTEARTYSYSARNSSYVDLVIAIYGKIVAGIGATERYFLELSTEEIASNYQLAIANAPTLANISFNETYLSYTSSNDGATWNLLVGSYDAWVAPIQDGKQVQHKFVCYDDLDNNYTSPVWTYSIGRTYFDPTRTTIEYIYSDRGGYDYITNGSHNGTMIFRFLVGIDPDNGTVTSNATLVHAIDNSFVAMINASFGQDGLGVNISFNSTGIANGTYRVKTVAVDDEGSITEFITFNDFFIGVLNTPPNLTSVLCTPDLLLPNASISILPTGQNDNEANTLYYYCSDSIAPTSLNTNCSEGNTGYAYPYASMNCTFNVENDTGIYTKYCRTYDGGYYSAASWDTYTIYTVTTTIPYFNENTTIETLEIGHQIIDILGFELIKSKGEWRDKLLMIYVVILCFLSSISLIIIAISINRSKRGQ